MIKNWLIYLGTAAALFVFSLFHGFEQSTWHLFLLFVTLPLISLLLSLPFMLITSLSGADLTVPGKLYQDDSAELKLCVRSRKAVVMPFLRVRVRMRNAFAHDSLRCAKTFFGSAARPFVIEEKRLARHCGNVSVRPYACFVCDFLGMFFIPLRVHVSSGILVLPRPKPPAILPSADNTRVLGYRPKPGGGFSDYYELRPYRDGDSLKNIHWKLSGKYDDLVVREPSLPVKKAMAVRLALTDDASQNDGIMARFAYVAAYLTDAEKPFFCITPDGCCQADDRNAAEVCMRRVYDRELSRIPDLHNADYYTIDVNGEEVASS